MTVKSIKIINNKIIKNKKGDVIKFLNKKNNLFRGFGEIYFSEIKKNHTKGWNFHKKNTCTILVPFGSVEFNIFNPQNKKLTKITIGKKNNKIIQIPPGVWFSFKSNTHISLVANLMNYIHAKKEAKKSSIINDIEIK
jgi:dTDP-4-dehydrorhamnose 3,5-epimerase